jgi:hypothetical protein
MPEVGGFMLSPEPSLSSSSGAGENIPKPANLPTYPVPMKGAKFLPMIATPCYGGQLMVTYMCSVVELMLACSRHLDIVPILAMMGNESLIPRARNNLMMDFVNHELKPTHLVFIDADIGFQAQHLIDMISSGLPIVFGAYSKKVIEWDNVFRCIKEGLAKTPEEAKEAGASWALNFHDDNCRDGKFPSIPQVGADGKPSGKAFILCKEGSTGFMVIRREVIEAMIAAYPERWYHSDTNVNSGRKCYNLFASEIDPYPVEPEKRRFLSEDYGFCRLAKRIGIDSFVYTGAKLTHTGTYSFVGDFARGFAMKLPEKLAEPIAVTETAAPPAVQEATP